MKIKELIENVIIFNGNEEHIFDHNKSNFRIKNLVNWVSKELPIELIQDINNSNLQVYMETDLDYSKIKFINLESNKKDIILNFRSFTAKFCE